MDDLRRELIRCAIQELARFCADEDQAQQLFEKVGALRVDWGRYRAVLGPQAERKAVLSSIFARVRVTPGERPALEAFHAARPLALTRDTLFPIGLEEARRNTDRAGLWKDFAGEFDRLYDRLETEGEGFFEWFFYLFQKYAWAVPCSYGEEGLSLFEEWKAISAMAFASGVGWEKGPAAQFSLIGGDIPGIQDFVYTITSRGAAKGLRGRSFFVQLLNDAVLRRLLKKLNLSAANVIYSAGGNFMLLGPALPTIESNLEAERDKIEQSLLRAFEGDLALCLAWQALPQEALSGQGFSDVSRRVKEAIAEEKRHRFRALARAGWKEVFAPSSQRGSRYCAVCQRPLDENEKNKDQEWVEKGVNEYWCLLCDSFADLARQIATTQSRLSISLASAKPEARLTWQTVLEKVSGFHYQIDASPGKQAMVYLINDIELGGKQAHGFRWIANATPRVTDADIERWSKNPEEGETRPKKGDIRTFSQMAEVARGIRRVGVLRMDVDNLGQMMVSGLPGRSLAATAALSWALDAFFAGWLNQICQECNQQQAERGERLYTIYAGGDDLFITGAWDLLPELAHRIRQDFASYTGQNSDLHLSGGITLEGRKFPIYQAAERAGQAEEQAKSHTRQGQEKDAISFIGQALKWEEWREVVRCRQLIESAIGQEKAPDALIHLLQDLYCQYLQRRERYFTRHGYPKEPDYQVILGPWMWRSAYAITRMAERLPGEENEQKRATRQALYSLQQACLEPESLRRVALAARWVEFLRREE